MGKEHLVGDAWLDEWDKGKEGGQRWAQGPWTRPAALSVMFAGTFQAL